MREPFIAAPAHVVRKSILKGELKMSWNDFDKEDTTIYKVVVNHEEQFSIWPEYKENPLGWKDAGMVGTRVETLAYIKDVWTDMRPLSLRKRMEALAKNPPQPLPPDPDRPAEKSLVEVLCESHHPVEADLRPEKTAQRLKEAIDVNYVHIKFTDTRGGTVLGVRLDREACDFSEADFESGTGTVHIEGGLTLNFAKVRCVADLDLKNFKGEGHLVRVEGTAVS